MRQMKFDIFLSYSTKNEYIAKEVCDACHEAGLTCFMAASEIAPGSEWSDEIRSALSESGQFFILVTTESLRSSWVMAEWGAAWGMKKKITPILLEGCGVEEIPEPYREIHVLKGISQIGEHVGKIAQNQLRFSGKAHDLFLVSRSSGNPIPVTQSRTYEIPEGKLIIDKRSHEASIWYVLNILDGEGKGEYETIGRGIVDGDIIDLSFRTKFRGNEHTGWTGILSYHSPSQRGYWIADAKFRPGNLWFGKIEVTYTK